MKMKELLEEIISRKHRCEKALGDPGVTPLVKIRVLTPEYNILLLALEGYEASQQKEGKQGLLSTRPATIVGHQTD